MTSKWKVGDIKVVANEGKVELHQKGDIVAVRSDQTLPLLSALMSADAVVNAGREMHESPSWLPSEREIRKSLKASELAVQEAMQGDAEEAEDEEAWTSPPSGSEVSL